MNGKQGTEIIQLNSFNGIPGLQVPITALTWKTLVRTRKAVGVSGEFFVDLPQNQRSFELAVNLLTKYGKKLLLIPILERFFDLKDELVNQGLTTAEQETIGPMKIHHGLRVLDIIGHEMTRKAKIEVIFSMRRRPNNGERPLR